MAERRRERGSPYVRGGTREDRLGDAHRVDGGQQVARHDEGGAELGPRDASLERRDVGDRKVTERRARGAHLRQRLLLPPPHRLADALREVGDEVLVLPREPAPKDASACRATAQKSACSRVPDTSSNHGTARATRTRAARGRP